MKLQKPLSLALTTFLIIASSQKIFTNNSILNYSPLIQTDIIDNNISKEEAQNLIEKAYKQESTKSKQQLQNAWSSKKFTANSKTLKFEVNTYGNQPKEGRSLYISMHGGGGAAAYINDGQWKNQIAMTSNSPEYYHIKEGVVVVPRAPVDEWNMWFQSEMDAFIEQIIRAAVLFENVNPNKVYIMGYSAGGDGTFRLAARLADFWAAASMSAGHPGEVKPTNLRNIGFALNMGGQDAAYNRNGLAREWKKELEILAKNNPNEYKHQVNIFENDGHWMSMKDKISIPFMAGFTRNPYPNNIDWMQNSFALRDNFYWIGISNADMKKEGIADSDKHIIKICKTDNIINIEENYASEFYIYLNDNIVDLDKEVTINYKGRTIFKGKVTRKSSIIEKTAAQRKDKAYIFSAQLIVKNNSTVLQGA